MGKQVPCIQRTNSLQQPNRSPTFDNASLHT